ncbi:MAG: cyclic nucleotide-binding domain-containing protein [Deltaproteobacteria bacterium]|nr:MAG: cyclic nucleotide-binding domain-containing protein [Deltaproteobacteria bacterium]
MNPSNATSSTNSRGVGRNRGMLPGANMPARPAPGWHAPDPPGDAIRAALQPTLGVDVRDPSMLMAARVLPAQPAPGDAADPDAASVIADCLQAPELSLLVVGEARGPRQEVPAALRVAFDRVRVQLSRNHDLVERLARHPDDDLRRRVEQRIGEAMVQASREIHALGLRRGCTTEVELDVVVALPTELLVAHAGRGAVMLVHAGLVHRLTAAASPEEPMPRSLEEDLGSMVPAGAPAHAPLGSTADPPAVETMAVDLRPGDRVVLLAPSVAAGVDRDTLRQALRIAGLGEAIEEIQARSVVPPDRPRAVAAMQVGPAVADAGRERIATLQRMELFRWCSDGELSAMAELAVPRSFGAGTLLLRQGAMNRTLYLLVSGRVAINKDGQRIAEVDSGVVLGEMSMLDDPRASATVEALTPVEVLTLDRESFLAALKADANMAVKVLWSLLLRVSSNLRQTSERLAEASASGLVETVDDAATVLDHRSGRPIGPADPTSEETP